MFHGEFSCAVCNVAEWYIHVCAVFLHTRNSLSLLIISSGRGGALGERGL